MHNQELLEHWSLKRLWSEELNKVAVGAEEGREHGEWLHWLEAMVFSREVVLEEQHRMLEEARWSKIAAMNDETTTGVGTFSRPITVLQTYTFPLQQMRRELEKWKEPLTDEYLSLTSNTKALRPTTTEALKDHPNYAEMEVAPAMVVPTVKAPFGKHRAARMVICGNRVELADPEQANKKSQEPEREEGREVLFGNYAGGADATLLRCLFRKTAHERWTLGSVDVKTAFLLAHRQRAKESVLVAIPPRVLVEAGIVKENERWIIDKAMYGLDSSPADWRVYRDTMLQQFKWELNGLQHELRPTPEGNLWQVIATQADGKEKAVGYVAVYVDDLLAVGPDDVVRAVLQRITQEWKCSEPEFVGQGRWMKIVALNCPGMVSQMS